MDTTNVEELLEHSDWLRKLAGRLVADPAAADDLVQETFVVALRRPPLRGGSQRSWLASVLGNLVRNSHRSRARREEREQLAWAEETPPTPEQLALEAEGQRMIAEAVAELPESLRAVVVLRYFRGLDSNSIGRMQGVSPNTVRGQLRRALDELRSQFDREHGGRAAWVPLLSPALPTAAKTSSTTIAMGPVSSLKVSLVITILGLLPFVGFRLYSGMAAAPAAPLVSASPAPSAALAANAPLATASPASASARASTLAPGSVAVLASEPVEQPVVLRGRFLFPDGTPVVGLALKVSAGTANAERSLLYGVPNSWEAPTPVTDEQGRFESVFVAPRAFQFSLSAKREEYVEDRWRWGELFPGTEMDLGEVTLRRGGKVEGTLTREGGTPMIGETWRVQASELAQPTSNGRTALYVFADVDRDTGSFHFEDMPVGSLLLKASSAIAGRVTGPTIEVVEGETVTAGLVYAGPDNSRRIVVSTRNRLMSPLAEPIDGAITLVNTAGETVSATPVSGSANLYGFDDLEPGSYAIQIQDARFDAWSETDALTGARVRADLVGSAGIQLSLQGADGAPIELAAIRVKCVNVGVVVPGLSPGGGELVFGGMFFPNTFEFTEGGSQLTGGQLDGLLPGSYEVRVDAGDAGTKTVAVDDLLAGEQRSLVISLGSAGAGVISGVVRSADGMPAEQVEVLLLRAAEEDDSAASPVAQPGQFVWPDNIYRKPLAALVTDAEGAFAFESPGAGSFALLARSGEVLSVATDGFVLQDAEPRSGIELTLPAAAELVGHIVGPANSSCAGLRFLVMPATLAGGMMERMQYHSAMTRLLEAGAAYRSQELPAGEALVYLVLPLEDTAPGEGGSSSTMRWSQGEVPSEAPPHSIALGQIQLEPGTNEREFQVLEQFPGRAEVKVTSAGAALGGVKVSLHAAAAGVNSGERKGYTNSALGLAKITNFPGNYRVEVESEQDGWRYRHASDVTIAAAETLHVQLEFSLDSATLIARDANGEPLAGAALQITFAEGGMDALVGSVRTTGADGSIPMTLVPGEYRCYLYALDASDEDALRSARMDLFRDEASLPQVDFSWSEAGAQVGF